MHHSYCAFPLALAGLFLLLHAGPRSYRIGMICSSLVLEIFLVCALLLLVVACQKSCFISFQQSVQLSLELAENFFVKQMSKVLDCFCFITSAKEVMFLPDFVCLSLCQQDNSKSYGQIFLKF